MENYCRMYFEKWLFLERFMRKNLWMREVVETKKRDHQFSRMLMKNSFKCILIAHILFFGHEFAKGKRFYLVYVKSSCKAMIFGFLYSVYYNDEKLELYLAKKNFALDPK